MALGQRMSEETFESTGGDPSVAVPDVPESHATYAVEACGWCHAADAAVQTKDVPAIAHDLAGREKCLMCHRQGVMEAVPDIPADHAPRAETTCGMCHKPAAKP